MNNKEEILKKVADAIRADLSVEGDITRSTMFKSELEFDSLDCVDLYMRLENEFDMTLEKEYDELTSRCEDFTVGELVDMLYAIINA